MATQRESDLLKQNGIPSSRRISLTEAKHIVERICAEVEFPTCKVEAADNFRSFAGRYYYEEQKMKLAVARHDYYGGKRRGDGTVWLSTVLHELAHHFEGLTAPMKWWGHGQSFHETLAFIHQIFRRIYKRMPKNFVTVRLVADRRTRKGGGHGL